MDDPNKILVEVLREHDQEFRNLDDTLRKLKEALDEAPTESKKKSILKQMRSLRERVEARISYARSA